MVVSGNFSAAAGDCARAADANANVGCAVEYIDIDTTTPQVSGVAVESPNANGWYTGPVTIRFTASDATSGLASVTPDIVLTVDGIGQSAAGISVDNAGNAGAFTVTGINIDAAAPWWSSPPR